VQEIIRVQRLTRVPNSPKFVDGVINLRGRVIPVIDLRKRFGIDCTEQGNQTRIVVVEVKGTVLGFIVDSVSEVLRIPAESEELLEGMNQDLVALEQAPDDTELLNRIFRALHTIKGTSGFLNFDPVVRLSHRAEDVLNTLRRSEVEFSRRIMDALLAARDQ